MGHLGEEVALGAVGDFSVMARLLEVITVGRLDLGGVDLGDGDAELTGEGLE